MWWETLNMQAKTTVHGQQKKELFHLQKFQERTGLPNKNQEMTSRRIIREALKYILLTIFPHILWDCTIEITYSLDSAVLST